MSVTDRNTSHTVCVSIEGGTRYVIGGRPVTHKYNVPYRH